ncbi:Gp49 family protein [Acinetobacter thermotolerans]|uniref:Gp49 family protein n=1 Tax=Acinetobacter thermotolerans TaxID=3151487 RepID=UPI00325B27D7
MSNSEQQIEQEIQDKGLNAPRLTPDHIDSKVKVIRYLTGDVTPAYTADGYENDRSAACLTICILTLENGFTVTGESACASPENFDKLIGQKIAYENARNKIWQLEGYLLKEKLHQAALDNQF